MNTPYRQRQIEKRVLATLLAMGFEYINETERYFKIYGLVFRVQLTAWPNSNGSICGFVMTRGKLLTVSRWKLRLSRLLRMKLQLVKLSCNGFMIPLMPLVSLISKNKLIKN